MNKKIEIEIPEGKVAEWKEINGVKTLVLTDEKDNRPVTERIKTFEDACGELGDEHPLVKEYWGVININLDIKQDLISYLKLRIICAALNEGWEPQFTNDEYLHYPWFYIYTQEEIDNMDEENNGINIYVGKDSELTDDVSVIKTKYNHNGEEGTIAIIGPKRMEYERVVNLLNYIKENIEDK